MLLGTWELAAPGIEPMSSASAGGFLITGLPGKPLLDVSGFLFMAMMYCFQPFLHFENFFLFFNLNIGASGKHVPPAPQHRSQTHEPSCSSSQRSSRCPSFEYFSKSLQQFPAAVNNGNYNYRASPLRSSKHFLDAAALILVTRV